MQTVRQTLHHQAQIQGELIAVEGPCTSIHSLDGGPISTLHTQSRGRRTWSAAAAAPPPPPPPPPPHQESPPATPPAAAAAATDTDSTHWCSSSAQTMKISPSVSTLILLAPALGTAIRKKKNQRET